MINNIQNLFIKYKNNKNYKKEAINTLLLFLEKELDIKINKENFKIDFKKKTIYLNKNSSSIKFLINSKLTEENVSFLEKELDYKIYL
ncbi:MAG: hypothetical protein KBD12_00430 [Candidatus Pacebacteria bacterium]|nr:hypothetical protein [Candidatus Paceibacterota bacterium]